MKLTLILLMHLSLSACLAQNGTKVISKNQMLVKWKIEKDRIQFEIEAPTKGWIAIGFNDNEKLSDTYLIMGRVSNNIATIVEHYTSSPGNYKALSEYGIHSQLKNIEGEENADKTSLKFTIIQKAYSKYHKNLMPQSEWVLLMAYSLDDDFQHHSIMRTSTKIKL